jgi:hypothetical protein
MYSPARNGCSRLRLLQRHDFKLRLHAILIL